MNSLMRNSIAGVMCLAFALVGCKKFQSSFTPTCTGTEKSFKTDVSPLIIASCTASGCHNSGSKEGPGALLTYAQISAAKSQIRSEIVSGRMPKGSSLTDDQKNAIVCWIDAGAQNN